MIKQRIIFFLLAAFTCLQAVAAVPGLINYSGRLTDSQGAAITGPTVIRFTFWNAATSGTQLGGGYEYQATVTPNMDGVYSVAIGDGEPVPAAIFDAPAVWLNVTVNGEHLTPRARITSVGYAFRAEAASTAWEALALRGGSYVMPLTTGTALENGASLLAAYAEASAMTPGGQPLTTTSRAVVLVPPGHYDLLTDPLLMDTEFVDLVGLSSAREDQFIFGGSSGIVSCVLRQTANNVRIENLTVKYRSGSGLLNSNASDPAAYFPDSGTSATVVRNCEFQANGSNAWSMRVGMEYSGYYENCAGGLYAFGGGLGGIAGGAFINCTGGLYAFGGGLGGTAGGTFEDCTGGLAAFGGFGGTASGTFTDCTGGNFAFGGFSGTAGGTFINCKGGFNAFGGGFGGTASGTFTNCTGEIGTFGGNDGIASGIFTNCTGGNSAFGGGGGVASGTFSFCTGGDNTFGGGLNGVASGTFSNCTGGDSTFGTDVIGTAPGGQFYYCQGWGASFTTAGSPAPIHRYCLRGQQLFPSP